MKQTGTCPKCGSQDIVADATAIDRAHGGGHAELTLATYRKPTAIIFKEMRETSVSAWMCVECGYIELYADFPKRIKLPQP